MSKPIIIDTDPGIDDAAAIGLALFRPALDVKLLSVVHGNVSLAKTLLNARRLKAFFGTDTPVAAGLDAPLLYPPRENNSSGVHGVSGLDGWTFTEAPGEVETGHAIEHMRDIIMKSSGHVTLIPIGPLTNIALLFKLYPEVIDRLDAVVLMGGSLSGGNVTSAAEFNIWADPHAAKMTFASGAPLVMVGLDVTETALITEEDLLTYKSRSKAAAMFDSTFRHYGDGDMTAGVAMHDSCAVAFTDRPDLFTTVEKRVEVVTEGAARGMTMEVPGKPNCRVTVDMDTEGFRNWFTETLAAMP
ncbi:nucleoside hydrolase [Alkalicoccus urumqiensis]|uniref:Ribonucleoside hydrolase RihC n=1 Tax=Alkalicoccus urumqiensis TaxID=1548213 RepID=A0A2P6MH70_ALKUR|nr:nucleoside hydrolase [Alkalicoccus urumqiensis]PRO65635.1 ribonucleoside hydrolase RihC [Alkalicoccus urumqiensis]